jgi:hypothetical protein
MLVLRIEPVADGSPSMAKELCVVSHAYLLKGRCVLLGNEGTGVAWLRIQVVDTSPAAAHKLQYNPDEQSASTLHSSPICCIKKQKNPTIQQSLPHGNCPILIVCHHNFLSIGFLTTVQKKPLVS